MQYRRFGRTGLQVSVMGLGTGGPSNLGQASGVSETEARKVVRRALELDINLIDTAADYNESEAILGRALQDVPRDSYVLCTKFHAVNNQAHGDLKSSDAMVESIETSLQRLGTDHVDVFQLHGVKPDVYERVRDRFVPVMQSLRQQGKCRFVGISEVFSSDHEHATLRKALADDIFETIMVGYNLLSPMPEEHVLPEARRKDVGVLVMCAVRVRIGRPDKLDALVADLKARGDLAADALPDRDPLGWLVHDGIDSVSSAAYQFVVGNPAVSCCLTGTANLRHLEQNVNAIHGAPLPAADRQRLIETFGPIRRSLGD